jgi:hypothetical protein
LRDFVIEEKIILKLIIMNYLEMLWAECNRFRIGDGIEYREWYISLLSGRSQVQISVKKTDILNYVLVIFLSCRQILAQYLKISHDGLISRPF